MAWPVFLFLLLLILVPGRALAGTPISAASLERAEGRTRIVIESKTELRFSLFVLRYPERLVLELEGVVLSPVLAGLADQVAADHPYLKPLQIRPSPSGAEAEAVQLEFGLRAEAEPRIHALKPEAGRGYRLVLDIVPVAVATPSPSAGMPRLPQRRHPLRAHRCALMTRIWCCWRCSSMSMCWPRRSRPTKSAARHFCRSANWSSC